MSSCSREMAGRIVGLLMADVGLGCVYTPRPTTRSAPPAARAKTPEQRSPINRKVTPEIAAFILRSDHLPVVDIMAEVQQRFNVSLSKGTVYKELQSRYSVTPCTPTPTTGRLRVCSK